MKTIILFLTIFLTQCSSKQSNETASTNTKDENEVTKENYQIKLIKVTADSRCPEGVNCIWEGQVEMTVGVYKAEKLVEEKELIVNSKTAEENATWASKYTDKPVKFIGVLPNRVKDTPVNESDYKLLLKYN